MKKIVFLAFDLGQKGVTSVEYSKKAFYERFVDALRMAGNEVLCIDCQYNKPMPKDTKDKLEQFYPDICFLANYGLWDLTDIVDCPLCYMDIDGLENVSMPTIYRMRNNIGRCFFIISNPSHVQMLKEKFNADDKQIISIGLPYEEISKNENPKTDVIYIGTNFLENKDAWGKQLQVEQKRFLQYEKIRSKCDLGEDAMYEYSSKQEDKQLRQHLLSLNKNRYLTDLAKSKIALEIRGPGWRGSTVAYYPEIIKSSEYSLDYKIDSLRKTYDQGKIALFFNDNFWGGRGYLMLMEALSSNACVVVERGSAVDKWLISMGVLLFTSEGELRDVCNTLLTDEEKRNKIVKKVHQSIEKSCNSKNILKTISKQTGIVVDNPKSLKKSSQEQTEDDKQTKTDVEINNIASAQTSSPKIVSITKPSTPPVVTKPSVAPVVSKPITPPVAKAPANAKKDRFARVKRLMIHFGYDFYNMYPKKCYMVGPIILYEKLNISKTESHIFILSMPLFSFRSENGKKRLGFLFFEKSWGFVKKATKKLIARPVKKAREKRKLLEVRKAREKYYASLREKIKRGEKIKVCLFVSRISCWTFSSLYKILQNSKYFEPIVVVKPFMYQGHDAMVNYMDTTYNKLKEEGYNVIRTYDEDTDTFLDLKSAINPDIIFYTKYWIRQFHPNYYINNFLDRITFYTSYCFDIAYHPEVMNFELTNKVDRYFMASDIHKKMAIQAMDNKAENVHVVGAPKLDVFFDKDYKATDVWKPQEQKKKRIIWAPHHSDQFPKDLYQFNAFYELTEFMFDMARKYENQIQIAFKPHPMLLPYLYKKWGKELADTYYEKWANLSNGQLETGEFIDLFLTSDAMILDSISFIAEYTAVNKPAFFTVGSASRVNLNEFGTINFEVLYNTQTNLKEDIEKFIVDVVINGEDYKKEKRTQFIEKYLLPPNGKSASENIYENMLEEIMKGPKFK